MNSVEEAAFILFQDFETLDVFGPAEILGRLKDNFHVEFYSVSGGIVSNMHNVSVSTKSLPDAKAEDTVFIIPGGIGTRKLVNDVNFLDKLKRFAESSEYILTICTGSALLAKTGLIDGKKAASNKIAFEWVKSQSCSVEWIKKARWVKDGNIYSSSGISAGIDMTLGFVSDYLGYETAKRLSIEIEYNRQENPEIDNFAL
jgi:putative intracellular protease/amidase